MERRESTLIFRQKYCIAVAAVAVVVVAVVVVAVVATACESVLEF